MSRSITMPVFCDSGFECPLMVTLPAEVYAEISARNLWVIVDGCENPPPYENLVEVCQGYSLYQPVTQ